MRAHPFGAPTRYTCRHGWLTGPGPGACTAGCNPPDRIRPLERPWPDRAAANTVHAALMGLFLTIAAGRAVHRVVTSTWQGARTLAATTPWGRTR